MPRLSNDMQLLTKLRYPSDLPRFGCIFCRNPSCNNTHDWTGLVDRRGSGG